MRRTFAWIIDGQTLRAAFELTPLKISAVPLLSNTQTHYTLYRTMVQQASHVRQRAFRQSNRGRKCSTPPHEPCDIICGMPYTADFNTVSTVGLESSPVVAALAGLRAHEARYFKTSTTMSSQWGRRATPSRPSTGCTGSSRRNATSSFRLVYSSNRYESGLSINMMYTVDDSKKRAVRFKLSEGMEVPVELASKFKFASQKSKLGGADTGVVVSASNGTNCL